METKVDRGPSALTSIEKVMLLQSLELFRFCSTEEILRIAEIAQERSFETDEVIYKTNEPADSLYCIVAGEVRLAGDHARSVDVGARQAFGVIEILSGRLRRRGARATRQTTVLAIEAEDFFDLLSNNVEIVKALFRKILQEETPAPTSSELR